MSCRAAALCSLAFALLATGPTRAKAHSRWQVPPARVASDSLMVGPCGDVARTDAPTEFRAGASVDLSWVMSQSHGNTFRIAFSPADDLGFEDNVLGSLPDQGDTFEFTQEVALPECTCDACTLQLRQLSTSGNAAYYSCADIRLISSDPLPPCAGAVGTTGDPTGDPDTSTGDPPGAETTTASDGDTTGDGGPRADDDGSSSSSAGGEPTITPDAEATGCGCSTRTGADASSLAWAAVLLVARRRRGTSARVHT